MKKKIPLLEDVTAIKLLRNALARIVNTTGQNELKILGRDLKGLTKMLGNLKKRQKKIKELHAEATQVLKDKLSES